MIRQLMGVLSAAASQRLIFFADGGRFSRGYAVLFGVLAEPAYGKAPTTSVGCVSGQIAV